MRIVLVSATLCIALSSAVVGQAPSEHLKQACPDLFDPNLPPPAVCSVARGCADRLADVAATDLAYLQSRCPDLGAPNPMTGPDPGLDARLTADFNEPRFSSLSVFLDNDVFIDGPLKFTPIEVFNDLNEDRNYTMGLSLQLSGSWVGGTGLFWPLQQLDHFTGVDALHTREAFITRGPDMDANKRDRIIKGTNRSHSFTIGQTAFTPDSLNTPDPLDDDRPYASMFIFSSKRSTAGPYRSHKSELTVGLLGLGITRHVQTWIHTKLRGDGNKPYDPEGWHHQVSDGFEPTARYAVSGQWLLAQSNWHDLTGSLESSLGYYTNLGSSLRFRLGRINSYYWAFNDDPNGTFDQALRPRDWELYAWGSIRSRLWAYDVLLQGGFRDSDVTVATRDIERVVVDGRFGLNLTVHRVSLTTVMVAGRTPEFRGDRSRSHFWGGFYFTWFFDG